MQVSQPQVLWMAMEVRCDRYDLKGLGTKVIPMLSFYFLSMNPQDIYKSSLGGLWNCLVENETKEAMDQVGLQSMLRSCRGREKEMAHDQSMVESHKELYKNKYRVYLSLEEQQELVRVFCRAQTQSRASTEARLEFVVELWDHVKLSGGTPCVERFSVLLTNRKGSESWTWCVAPHSQFVATVYFGHALDLKRNTRFPMPSHDAQTDVLEMLTNLFQPV